MLGDILYFLKAAFFVIALVLVLMIPFMLYLYWLNNKQNRYFKKLGSELNLEYSSLGNKIKRDFPELNGFIENVQCFIGARRSKGRYGSSAQTRNHYPIIMLQFAIKKQLDAFNMEVSGKEIKYRSAPTLKLNREILTRLQYFAKEHENIAITQTKNGILQVLIKDELSNEKQYKKVKALTPLLVKLALDINQY